MGLRFKKSISIIPGVKLNFGKTGMSLSAGVPGLRKTFHTSGKTTTSIGIPGTGLSYVTTENRNKENSNKDNSNKNNSRGTFDDYGDKEMDIQDFHHEDISDFSQNITNLSISRADVINIHKVADEAIDWTEVMVNKSPPDDTYNKKLWSYCHNVSKDILSGDIDTYLKVIGDINPLNDLLAYGSGFEFGTDSRLKMEVEFQIKSENLNIERTDSLFHDYVCSISIRIARDMFALLPIQNVVVHVEDIGKTILSICFDKKTINTLKFNFIDPSEIIKRFIYNMDYTSGNEFNKVERIEI